MKIITSFKTLIALAHELGQAELSGDSERISKAKKAHDEYKMKCLESDEMMLHCTNITLSS